MLEKADHAIRLQGPNEPKEEEDQGHRQRHVQVRIDATEQGIRHMKTVLGLDALANRPDAGNQTKPVAGKNEDEDAGEEPERFVNQVASEDAFEKPVQTLDQPLPEILSAAGDHI